jgi:hypothetical protein
MSDNENVLARLTALEREVATHRDRIRNLEETLCKYVAVLQEEIEEAGESTDE